jgi:hypothetical protein
MKGLNHVFEVVNINPDGRLNVLRRKKTREEAVEHIEDKYPIPGLMGSMTLSIREVWTTSKVEFD